MKEIALTKGYVAQVDDADYDQASQYRWFAQLTCYSVYAARRVPGMSKQTRQYLHQFIVDAAVGEDVDHRDHNGLNCQRDNLRRASRAQNQYNRGIASNNTSGVKGVTKKRSKWQASISADGRLLYLGVFNTAEDAACAYDFAALLLHGTFGVTNS